MGLHQDLAGNAQNYAELITGTFGGVKVIIHLAFHSRGCFVLFQGDV